MAKNIMSKAKRREDDEAPPVTNQCQANGCPLIGTGSHSTNNSVHKWFCEFHLAEEKTEKWGMITARIRNHIDVYNWYSRLTEVSFLDFHEHPEKYYPHRMPHLEPKDGENLLQYKKRIHDEFKRLVSLSHTGSNAA